MAAPPIAERHKPHFHRKAPVLESVRVATTADVTIATALNSGDTIDGIILADGDRVLVKNQSTGSQNGIYEVAATPVRAYDQSTDDPGFGFLVYVREGTANGGTIWRNTNTSSPTIGSTSLTFSQFSSGGVDLSGIDFLVGTASGLLSGEIVAGTTPGGELGGTWGAPTVDTTHAGSAHVTALDGLTDVVITSATNADRLRYNSATAVWEDSNLVWEPMIASDGSVMTDGLLNPMLTEVPY